MFKDSRMVARSIAKPPLLPKSSSLHQNAQLLQVKSISDLDHLLDGHQHAASECVGSHRPSKG